MCFHGSLKKKADKVRERFKADFSVPLSYEPFYHLSGMDHPSIYIIRQGNEFFIDNATWGIYPENEPDPFGFYSRTKGRGLNARSERVNESLLYKEPIEKRRCIILMDGFFENKYYDNIPFPHYIRQQNDEAFAIAGIYNQHDEDVFSCSILTTKANEYFGNIHNKGEGRMPIILDEKDEFEWLRNDLNKEEVDNLLWSFTSQEFIDHPVSRDLNKNKVDTNKPSIFEKIYFPEIESRLF